MNGTETTKKIISKLKIYLINIANTLNPIKLWKTFLYQFYFYKFFNKQFPGIHLGSGSNKINNFLNLDASWITASDVVGRIEKLKFADNSIGVIYNSHVLEHIPRAQTEKVIQEWYRALKTDGIIYLSVPDLEELSKLYSENINDYYNNSNAKRAVNFSTKIIYGGQSDKYDFHCAGFSFAVLKEMLEQSGFKKIEKYDFRNLNLTSVPDASYANFDGRSISLNIKAIK